ncbi:NUDIX hydrolase [Alteribacillus sp. HJP-4]|uniref:NUDIX hydrolase n=1 Tax=Alteribacillus sp. HJP-4 TaxID=2775394 RepID=UPI0035CD0291
MNMEEKTIHKKKIFEGKIIELDVHEVELPDGKKSKREIITHPGAVAVIARNAAGKIIMVKQYRKALEKHLVEIPAGKLEKGEDARSSAARELEEETGYKAKTFDYLQSFYTSPGFADEIVYLFEAGSLYEGSAGTDEDEFVDVIEVDLKEAQAMIENEEIHDAKTVFAIQYLLLKERDSFK